MKKKKWLLTALAAGVIIIAVLSVFIFKGNGTEGIKYKTEEVKKGSIEAVVSTTGTVNPVTLVEVGSQVSGRIAKIHVDFNSQVKAGQVVAEIDPSQIMTRIKQNEANYESSRASLEKARVNFNNITKQYKRSQQLFEKELISFEEKENVEAQYLGAKSDVRSAEAHLLQAKSQLESTNVDLDYSVIKSPIDGVVISRNVNVGQTVAASFQAPVLFTIADDLGKMQVECSIDEADIGKIKEGQDVRFTVDAFPNEEFKGKVSQVRYSPEVIQNVVTYTTIVAVDNPGLKLRPGMTATVTIVAGKAENVLMVPVSATRFTPPLSQEEMMAVFQKMRDEMMERRGAATRAGSSRSGQPGVPAGGMDFFGGSRTGADSSQRSRQATRVWILEKNGQVKPVFIRPGVTDDSYIEVIRGEIEEGQSVITGLLSGPANQEQSDANRMRGMGMMFRR